MAKPFSIQSPEDIAKEYGGNKQKIGQAMQLGVVDPTAGVLAGMFIDRMRNAQITEGANPPTVAQQVMGGAPPQSPGLPAPGGVGMPPQGAPPMAPPPGMGAPPMPEGPPMGMAEGGIVGLDIPDTMFDESSNGGFDEGYAGGGLVAFGAGGYTLDSAYERILKLEGGLGPKGEMRVSRAGAVGPAQLMPDTAPEAARLAGLPWDEERYRTDPEYNKALGKAYYAARVTARKGDYEKAALDYHTGMGNVDKGKIGPAGRQYLREFKAGSMPERDISTASGRAGSLEDLMQMMGSINKKSPEEVAATDKYRAMLTERASDEDYEKQRKEDMWATLAEIGFNMASSKSPSVLQAIGEAAAAALPGARASKKERKESKDHAIEGLMELGARDRKEAAETFKTVVPLWQEGIRAEQFEKDYGFKERDLTQQAAIAREQMGTQKDIAAMRPESMDFRESFAKSVYADYKRRNANGNLIVNGKRLPPNSVSDEQLRVMAMQEVANRIPFGQQGASTGDANINGIPDAMEDGGGRQPAPNTSRFKVLGTE